MVKIKDFISCNIYRIIAVILILVLAISLIPIFTISFYNYPTRDDYFLGYNVYKSHDTFIDTLKSAFERAEIAYNNWQGLFTVNFLLAFVPSSFGSEYYAITTFVGILFLIISTYYFGYQLLVKLMKFERVKYIIITSLTLFISIQFLPSPVEGFYWYPAVMTYTIPYSIMITFFGLVISFILNTRNKKVSIFIIPLILLSVFISGCNYIVVLFTLGILFFATLYLFKSKKSEYKVTLTIMLIMIAGLITSIISPGNAIRALGEQGLPAFLAILISFPAAIRSLLQIFCKLPVLIGVFILIPLIYKAVHLNKVNLKFNHPMIVLFLSLCLYACTFTPTYYAMYGTGLGRVENIRMFMLIWIVIVDLYYFIAYFDKSFVKTCKENNLYAKTFDKVMTSFIEKHKVIFSLVLLLIFVASMYSMDLNRVTSTSAAISLFKGEARQYKKEQLIREELYLSEDKNIVVDELTVKPYVLYFWDITDSYDGRYIDMEKYYNKESITIK